MKKLILILTCVFAVLANAQKLHQITVKKLTDMAATSNHTGDVGLWLEKVIDSCETHEQEDSARRLVRLFEDRLHKEKSELRWEYPRKLRNRLDEKYKYLN